MAIIFVIMIFGLGRKNIETCVACLLLCGPSVIFVALTFIPKIRDSTSTMHTLHHTTVLFLFVKLFLSDKLYVQIFFLAVCFWGGSFFISWLAPSLSTDELHARFYPPMGYLSIADGCYLAIIMCTMPYGVPMSEY